MKKPSYFNALPPYMGGKRKLLGWIFGHLSQCMPVSQWQSLSFADAFAGGGSVSLFAKAQGFQKILANDWSARSQLVIQGLLKNSNTLLTPEDLLYLTQPHPNPERAPIDSKYASSVFSKRHARALDQLIHWANQYQCPTKRAMSLLLVWHLIGDFVSFGTSIGKSNRPFAEVLDGLSDWQGLNPKRFQDKSFTKLLKPAFSNLKKHQSRINAGVIGGSAVKGYQQEALRFISENKADILYLDPPYPGTLCYESSFRVLDDILGLPSLEKSPFSKGPDALEALLDGAKAYPVWMLSYGCHRISLDELVKLVQKHAGARKVQGFSMPYQHLAHVSKAPTEELLVLAY